MSSPGFESRISILVTVSKHYAFRSSIVLPLIKTIVKYYIDINTISSTPSTASPSYWPAASVKLLYFEVFQCTRCSSPEKERPSTVCSEPCPSTAPQWQCHCCSLYTSVPSGPPRNSVTGNVFLVLYLCFSKGLEQTGGHGQICIFYCYIRDSLNEISPSFKLV